MKTALKHHDTIDSQMAHAIILDDRLKAKNNQRIITLKKTYQYELTPFLKDSNAYGNIYFARYFEWQGICREMWFTECIYPDMLQMDGAFLTRTANNHYMQEVLPFQQIQCALNVQNLKRTSFDLIFKFYNQKAELVSSGYQTVVYTDSLTGRIKKIPEDVMVKVKAYHD